MARTLFRGAAYADGRSDRLVIEMSALVEDGRLVWLRSQDDEGDLSSLPGVEVVDASGGTIVPGMVDAHSHITLPGGAHYLQRIDDGPEELLRVAERNGALLSRAGVRWARDTGSPRYPIPGEAEDKPRALALEVRNRWRHLPGRPYIVAAGTWLDRVGTFPPTIHAIDVASADELLAGAVAQLDEGADMLKLYMDGPDPETSPWTVDEVARVTSMAHARGARVTAHSTRLYGAAAAVRGGVDSIEHGERLDSELCAEMARRGTFLVSTLSVYHSWAGLALTTRVPRFASEEGRAKTVERRESAVASLQLAHRAGVRIAAGTDFGGGSVRAGHLAGEVELLVGAGLEPWEALAAATWRGGELLGNDAGVLSDGGPADFFLVHGDPLTDPAALWRVWRVAWEE